MSTSIHEELEAFAFKDIVYRFLSKARPKDAITHFKHVSVKSDPTALYFIVNDATVVLERLQPGFVLSTPKQVVNLVGCNYDDVINTLTTTLKVFSGVTHEVF